MFARIRLSLILREERSQVGKARGWGKMATRLEDLPPLFLLLRLPIRFV